jgi:hypothetical protein
MSHAEFQEKIGKWTTGHKFAQQAFRRGILTASLRFGADMISGI